MAYNKDGPVIVIDNYDSFTYNLCQVSAPATVVHRRLVESTACGTLQSHTDGFAYAGGEPVPRHAGVHLRRI
jgi:anthranilate/para-aminobenzoate synthase component II